MLGGSRVFDILWGAHTPGCPGLAPTICWEPMTTRCILPFGPWIIVVPGALGTAGLSWLTLTSCIVGAAVGTRAGGGTALGAAGAPLLITVGLRMGGVMTPFSGGGGWGPGSVLGAAAEAAVLVGSPLFTSGAPPLCFVGPFSRGLAAGAAFVAPTPPATPVEPNCVSREPTMAFTADSSTSLLRASSRNFADAIFCQNPSGDWTAHALPLTPTPLLLGDICPYRCFLVLAFCILLVAMVFKFHCGTKLCILFWGLQWIWLRVRK